MFRRFLNGALAAVALTSCVALVAATPAPKPMATPALNPKPQGAEVAFVAQISKDLNARFATPADAEKAGYFRFTNEDNTGSISYANLQWQSADPQHPSQLWYSVNGKLLGADYSVLLSNSPAAPNLWGVNPKRWEKFGHSHIHYILSDASGKETYGATSTKKFVAAGGSEADPQAQAIVKMGVAKSPAAVKKVFVFPALWDLQVWVTPNPNGAFAEMNPLVKPSANAEKDSM
ncbi:MAG TPA: hypothetical protein VFN49_11450 [Candidatus Aquilonibacter sp.]|nr:hypothetical protein [Candidatus Aquilonibacter sp.]